MKNEKLLGFIGQGWIGRNLADHFEDRGFKIVRYSLDPEFVINREKILDCDIVFIAVPAQTTPEGVDISVLLDAIKIVGEGKSVVIKSTLLPGTTDSIAEYFPNKFIFHSPEFLRETTVRFDVDNPDRNIVGIPTANLDDKLWNEKANEIMSILPISEHRATHKIICSATDAEFTKHSGNEFLCLKTIFMNVLYDLSNELGGNWDVISQNMMGDPRIGTSHMRPVHQYHHMGNKKGRGAGGHCFPKDFAAFRQLYEKSRPEDLAGIILLKAIEAKNNQLLVNSGKDIDILKNIYRGKPLCICDVLGMPDCICGINNC